jgi:putative nucleotidyltransferase with HDIG domain
LIILVLTAVIVICTVVVARRPGEQRPHGVYLESPSWEGSMAGGTATNETSHLAAPPCPAPIPEGARIRETSSVDPSGPEQLLDEVVAGLEQAPPLPHVLFQVLTELDSVGSSAASIASIVATEPVLTAAILRAANSAATGLVRRIISADEAVAYLGFSTVRALILRMQLAKLIPQRGTKGYDSEQLWVHSMVVAQVAAHLAKRVGIVETGLVSTIGLLHDIGKLAINSLFPDSVAKLWERNPNAPADESFLGRERRLFGADHAFIGGFLALRWKLPQELVDAIRLHHLPAGHGSLDGMSPELRRATRIVHVANQLAKYSHVYCADMEIDIVPEQLLTQLGLPGDLEVLLNGDVQQVIKYTSSMGGV